MGLQNIFKDGKTMSFKAIDNRLLKRSLKHRKKMSSLMNIRFYSEPVYGDSQKYIKGQIKIYGSRVNTNFQGKEIPEEDIPCKYLFVTNNARFCCWSK